MLVFAMMANKLPAWVKKEIDTICKRFFWQAVTDQSEANALVSWPIVARPTELGGLGVPDLKLTSIAPDGSSCKGLKRIGCGPTSLSKWRPRSGLSLQRQSSSRWGTCLNHCSGGTHWIKYKSGTKSGYYDIYMKLKQMTT